MPRTRTIARLALGGLLLAGTGCLCSDRPGLLSRFKNAVCSTGEPPCCETSFNGVVTPGVMMSHPVMDGQVISGPILTTPGMPVAPGGPVGGEGGPMILEQAPTNPETLPPMILDNPPPGGRVEPLPNRPKAAPKAGVEESPPAQPKATDTNAGRVVPNLGKTVTRPLSPPAQ